MLLSIMMYRINGANTNGDIEIVPKSKYSKSNKFKKLIYSIDFFDILPIACFSHLPIFFRNRFVKILLLTFNFLDFSCEKFTIIKFKVCHFLTNLITIDLLKFF